MPNEPINRRGEKWVRGVGLVRALNQKLDEVDRRVVQIVRNVPAHRWKRSVVGAGSKSSCSINGLFAIFAPTVSYYFFLSLGRFATRSDLCPGFALNHPPSAANAARGTWADRARLPRIVDRWCGNAAAVLSTAVTRYPRAIFMKKGPAKVTGLKR